MNYRQRSSGVMAAISAAGSIGALARALGIDRAAVSRWRQVPADRLVQIEQTLGVRRELLRPDLYGGAGE